MAYIAQVSIRNSGHMENAIGYIAREEKAMKLNDMKKYLSERLNHVGQVNIASGERATFINCSDKDTYKDFEIMRKVFNQDKGVIAHHYYQSFQKDDNITPEQAHQIGVELAKKMFPNFQVVIATHIDREHIHNHIIVNSCNIVTGQKWYSIGSITVKMLDTVNVTLNIFPDITLKKSDVKIIGPILDAIVAFVVSAILMIIIGVVLVCVSIVMIKLVLRSIELAMLMVISPAFFACLSSDVTKEYFKKFISIFTQVAAQTLFMAIALAVCSGHFNTPAVSIDSLSGLAVGLIRISPNILIAIAMCVMMIKPPKVLTNLVK